MYIFVDRRFLVESDTKWDAGTRGHLPQEKKTKKKERKYSLVPASQM